MAENVISKAIIKRGGLIFGMTYGDVAQNTYDACCETLKFDESLRGRFGKQQDLYAEKATKEGYSVWFIINSNLSRFQDNKNHSDSISRDFLEIDEKFFNDPPKSGYIGEKRVVFARMGESADMFKFIGIFEMSFSTEDKMQRKYKRVENDYKLEV